MNSPSDTLKAAIEQFCDPDEETSREGYSRFFHRVHAFVIRVLAKPTLSDAERDDIAARVMGKLWENRHRTTFAGLGKWWNYVATTTRFCFIDYLRERSRFAEADVEELVATPDPDIVPIDTILEVMEDRRALYRLADDVFLGLPPDLTDRERDRRLLAAKLILLDKIPWHSVCTLLNAGAADDEEITRATLDDWLSNRGLIRHLAYQELYWDNEKLWKLIADPGRPSPWSPDEEKAIERRYRYAVSLDKIESLLEKRIKKAELSALFVRCGRRFPFIDIVKRLKRDMIRCSCARDELRAAGLWQRLVVQYHAKDGLTQPEILERIEPASAEAGYPVNAGMLTAAFGNKRLLKKMADHLERRDGNAVSSPTRRI